MSKLKIGKVETVAKAICKAAGESVNKTYCAMCEDDNCIFWKEFREEARSAIRALKNYENDKAAAETRNFS